MAKVTRKSRFGNQYQVSTDDCIGRTVTKREYDLIEIGDDIESGTSGQVALTIRLNGLLIRDCRTREEVRALLDRDRAAEEAATK